MPFQHKTTATPEIAKRLEEKAKVIHDILNSNETIDLWKLRGLAIAEGGLVNGMYGPSSWRIFTHKNHRRTPSQGMAKARGNP